MKSGHRLILIFFVATALVVALLCATSSDAQARAARGADVTASASGSNGGAA